MPDVYVPMSLGDAICWEAAMGLAAVLGIIAAIVIWGIIAIILGSLILVFLAIYFFAKKEAIKGIICLVAWGFCLLVSWGIYNTWARPIQFRNHVQRRFFLMFPQNVSSVSGKSTNQLDILEMKDGRIFLADSIWRAPDNWREISREEAKRWIERVIESDLRKRDDLYARSYLSDDLGTLDITVKKRWKKLSFSNKVGYVLGLFRLRNYTWHPRYTFPDPGPVIRIYCDGRLVGQVPPLHIHNAFITIEGKKIDDYGAKIKE